MSKLQYFEIAEVQRSDQVSLLYFSAYVLLLSPICQNAAVIILFTITSHITTLLTIPVVQV